MDPQNPPHVGSNGSAGQPNSHRPQPSTSSNPPTHDSNNARSAVQGSEAEQGAAGPPKRKNHRGGKKKKRRDRRQSFAAPSEDSTVPPGRSTNDYLDVPGSSNTRSNSQPFYRLGQGDRTRSSGSLDSEALLDHRFVLPRLRLICLKMTLNTENLHNRQQPMNMRPRKESRLAQNVFDSYRGGSPKSSNTAFRPAFNSHHPSHNSRHDTSRRSEDKEEQDEDADDKTPLMGNTPSWKKQTGNPSHTYGIFGASRRDSGQRKNSTSTTSSRKKRKGLQREYSFPGPDYDVNNPPSVPGSPKLGSGMGYDDVMMTGGEFNMSRSPIDSRRDTTGSRDALIDIDGDRDNGPLGSSPPSPRIDPAEAGRRHTIALPAEEDVCFPAEGMSEMAEEEEDYAPTNRDEADEGGSRRRRRRRWPDLSALEDWSYQEKEVRSEGVRAKKIAEPVLVGGRLRPSKAGGWHREDEENPFRFTYFNEEFQSTIHAQTISELVQPGGNFRELFIPDPPELDDSSSESDEEEVSQETSQSNHERAPLMSPTSQVARSARHSLLGGDPRQGSREGSGNATPAKEQNDHRPKQKRYGPRPTWWLDVLSPTDAEMRVISKTFGIHPLTGEDIMMQEAREKVELFRHYYFINYRTFEQDQNSEDFLEPLNMYMIVFRDGVLSFHFSQSPHPANVRRRIRQLKDYLILTSDWISYAIIDDITDVFQPLIQTIEDEVDDIDDSILQIQSTDDEPEPKTNASHSGNEKQSEGGGDAKLSGSDMLRRIGEGRKKVMGLYRLLGNKADVIKGFAKRCNEQWEVAPKSEIGLYLGDIQDHILTMTSNLSHYETLLSRAHWNYLAQINIRMNERAEKTADVLGKLTVLGTIVLPLNIVCGMWGMNVKVPGQEVDNLYWFFGSKSQLP